MKHLNICLLCIFVFSCDIKYENEFKTFVEKKGTLDSNNWEVIQKENIKFIHNKSWIKSEATGNLFTAFFDSTKKDIYTIVKVSTEKYTANQYIKAIIEYYSNNSKAELTNFEILEHKKKNSRVIHFNLSYKFYDELRTGYELLFENGEFLYILGLKLRKIDNKLYTGMNYNSEQLFQLLITKTSVDNELIIKNNESLKSIKELKLEDLE